MGRGGSREIMNEIDLYDLPVEDRVANGARWLDENFPGWEGRVDMNSLHLSDANWCICGQVFAKEADQSQIRGVLGMGYWFAEKTLFSEANSWINLPKREGGGYDIERASLVSMFLGFNTLEIDDDEEWGTLEEAWKELLASRYREAASL